MSVQSAMNQMLGTIGQLAIQTTAPKRFAEEHLKVQQAEDERIDKATDIELEHAVDLSLSKDEFGPAAEASEKKAEIAYRRFQRDPSQETYKTYMDLKEDAQNYRAAQNQMAEARRQAENEALEAQKNAQMDLMEQRQVRQDLLNNLKQVSTKEMVNEIVSRGQMSEKASQRYINREKKGVSK